MTDEQQITTEPAASTTTESAPAPNDPERIIPVLNSNSALPVYANFVRVSPAPEEIILEFGLNRNMPSVPQCVPVLINQQTAMSYFTAKRLFHALSIALQQQEQIFGEIEVDVSKRIVGRVAAPQV